MAFGKRTKRSKRYWNLREMHLFHKEALEFSRLKKKYPTLKKIVQLRSALWASFVREARFKGWDTQYKRKKEWRNKILSFYKNNGWIVTKDVRGKPLRYPTISPWDWFDFVRSQLPPELQWDTPRSHRVSQGQVNIKKIEMRRWIEDLKQTIAKTRDPKKIAQYQNQINSLELKIKKAKN